MIGATKYSYDHNFKGVKGAKRPIRKSIRIKWFNLIIDGYMIFSKFGDDLWVSLAQYLIRKGYPNTYDAVFVNKGLRLMDKGNDFQNFFMKSLFSLDLSHAQNLFINSSQFDLFKWREQFQLFEEVQIKGLNFYRNRPSMPIKQFRSFHDIKKLIFHGKDTYNRRIDKLNHSYNSSHPMALNIYSRDICVMCDYYIYTIHYGYEDSSWEIRIKSDIGENYIDFCIRLFNQYDNILNGKILPDDSIGWSFYKLKGGKK